jgi:RNA exonuclease 1
MSVPSWSGITAEAMAGATATFGEVQAQLLAMLSAPSTPVLLGHSLESDLKSLKICHPRCIDTAVIFHHPRGRPLKPGLAWLTKKWCGREIQNRGEGGHDPEEDARACMDLLRKKVANGVEIFKPCVQVVTLKPLRARIRRIQGRL